MLRSEQGCEKKEVGGDETRVQGLAPHNFTRAEAAEAASYRLGDDVVPIRNLKAAGLTADALYHVYETSIRSNRISLQPADGRTRIRNQRRLSAARCAARGRGHPVAGWADRSGAGRR